MENKTPTEDYRGIFKASLVLSSIVFICTIPFYAIAEISEWVSGLALMCTIFYFYFRSYKERAIATAKANKEAGEMARRSDR